MKGAFFLLSDVGVKQPWRKNKQTAGLTVNKNNKSEAEKRELKFESAVRFVEGHIQKGRGDLKT